MYCKSYCKHGGPRFIVADFISLAESKLHELTAIYAWACSIMQPIHGSGLPFAAALLPSLRQPVTESFSESPLGGGSPVGERRARKRTGGTEVVANSWSRGWAGYGWTAEQRVCARMAESAERGPEDLSGKWWSRGSRGSSGWVRGWLNRGVHEDSGAEGGDEDGGIGRWWSRARGARMALHQDGGKLCVGGTVQG